MTRSTTPETISREQQFAARNYAPLPVVLERGHGEWLTDVNGKRYLDLMSAYSAVSHWSRSSASCARADRQAQRVAVTSRAYHTAALGPFLEKLARLTGLDRALPANGGAEVVETAIKAARRWGYQVKKDSGGSREIVVARGNLHGRSTTIVGFSTEDSLSRGLRSVRAGLPAPSLRRRSPRSRQRSRRTPRAVLIEPIQGEAGIVVPPDGFLRGAARAVRRQHRVLMILDEIQSGLGRTGRWFAFQHEGIKPDGLILGKALGGGLLPVSCFVGDRRGSWMSSSRAVTARPSAATRWLPPWAWKRST